MKTTLAKGHPMTWAHTLLTAELLIKLVDKLDLVRSTPEPKEPPVMGDPTLNDPTQNAPQPEAVTMATPVAAPVAAPATDLGTAPAHTISDLIELVKILDAKPEILDFLKSIRAIA